MTNRQSAAGFETPWWRAYTWPAIIVGLLAGHIFIVTGALLLSSTWIPGASTATSGYAEAIHWDDLQALRAASERLGWTLEVSFADQTELNGERHVEFLLRDADGAPVEDAQLTFTLYHHSRPNKPIAETIEPSTTEPGRYRSTIGVRREGTWHVRASAIRGTERFLSEADFWVGPPLEASS